MIDTSISSTSDMDNVSLKQQNLFISPILLKILDLSSPRSSMTLALYMPQSAVNLAAQSLPGNKLGTHRGVRLVETWSKLSLRMSRADWEVAVQNQRDVLSWQTLVTVPGLSSWVGRGVENKVSATPYTQNCSNISCQFNKFLPRILNLTAQTTVSTSCMLAFPTMSLARMARIITSQYKSPSHLTFPLL